MSMDAAKYLLDINTFALSGSSRYHHHVSGGLLVNSDSKGVRDRQSKNQDAAYKLL
jgi:hypothetical protein